jgi:hypothetical protein
MDIQLFTINPTTYEIKWGLVPKVITGINKLVQIVVLSLLEIPGYDVLDPAHGSGIPSMIGDNIDAEDISAVKGEIARKIKKTQSEVIRSQVGLNCPLDEKLIDLKILNISQGESIDEIMVRIRVISAAGKAANVVL